MITTWVNLSCLHPTINNGVKIPTGALSLFWRGGFFVWLERKGVLSIAEIIDGILEDPNNPYETAEMLLEEVQGKMEELNTSLKDFLYEMWRPWICLEVKRARLDQKELPLNEDLKQGRAA